MDTTITNLFYDIHSFTHGSAFIKVAWSYASSHTSDAMVTLKKLHQRKLSQFRFFALPRRPGSQCKVVLKKHKKVAQIQQPWSCRFLEAKFGVRFLNQKSALRWAVHTDLACVCIFLQDFGLLSTLDPDELQVEFHYMLSYAAKHSHLSICQFLKDQPDMLKQHISVKALTNAAENGHLHICQFFKEWGYPMIDAVHALKLAIKNNHVDVVLFFREWGLRPNNWDYRRLLERTASHGSLAIGQILKEWVSLGLERVVWPETNPRVLWLAFKRAVKHGHMQFCQFLKEWTHTKPDGTVLTLTPNDEECNDVLKVAAQRGRLEVFHFFKQWHDEISDTPFSDNAWWPGKNITNEPTWMSVHGILIQRQSQAQNGAIFYNVLETAAQNGHLNICKFLLQDLRGFNVYSDGEALKRAAIYGHLHVCQFLRRWKLKGGTGGVLYRCVFNDIMDSTRTAADFVRHTQPHIYNFLMQWISECQ